MAEIINTEFEEIQSILAKGPLSLIEPELKKEWKNVFDRMVVHSRGVPPCDLLTKAFPNEDDEIREYREANYEPITSGIFDKGFDNLYRALSESNWSLNAPQELTDYLKDLNINHISFFQYLFKIVLRRKIEDPNGLLVVIPYGEGIKANDTRVDATIDLVLSSQICYLTEEVLIYKCNEKSEVYVPTMIGGSMVNRPSYDGDVFYVITDDWYYRYYQIGEKSKMDFQLEEYYHHEIGKRPFVVLGGRPTGKIDPITGQECFYYNSDFHAFVAHANEALRDKSTHTGVKATCAYPIRVMSEMPCDNKAGGCMNGVIYDEAGTIKGQCPRCKGTGNLIPTSVFKGVVLASKKEAPFVKNANGLSKAFEYIYPDVSILKHMGEESDAALLKAEKALQTKMVEMAQSGVAKSIDREDQYSMLYSFSDYWFEINVKKILEYIFNLLNPTSKEQIQIIKPVNFSIKDEATLLVEFTDAMKADVPQGILIDIYFDWIKKRFSGDRVRLKIEEISLMYAPFYIYSMEKRNELQLTGNISKEDYIKSLRITSTLWAIYSAKKEQFFEMDDAQFVKEIDARMVPFLPVIAPDLAAAIAAGGGGGDANAAESLRGSVGGLTGMIEIAKAVAAGLYDLEAAVALVSDRFGLSEADARKQLGTPQLQQIVNPAASNLSNV